MNRIRTALALVAVAPLLLLVNQPAHAETGLNVIRTTEQDVATTGDTVTFTEATVDVPVDSSLTDEQVYAALAPGGQAPKPDDTGVTKVYHTYWRQDVCVGMFNNCSLIGAGPGWWHLHHRGDYYRTGAGGRAWVSDVPPNQVIRRGHHYCDFDTSAITYAISDVKCVVNDDSDPSGYGYRYASTNSYMTWTVCATKVAVYCKGNWLARAKQYPGGDVVKEKNF